MADRAKAIVRVHLKEVVGGFPTEHTIDLRLTVVADPGDHADRVREIVLTKAARVLMRLKKLLSRRAASSIATHQTRPSWKDQAGNRFSTLAA